MNKNTQRRQRQLHEWDMLPPYAHKKKAKPFPKPNEDESWKVTMAHQRHIFNGVPCECKPE